jgi:arsenate reductase (thioredoxin)
MINVLFLCTHNSARSIIAEVLLNTLGRGKFAGFSAGSSPKTEINPIAKEIAAEMRYDSKKLYSKSWDEFAKTNAPKMYIIITVCDSAAKEVCPIWPGHPLQVHWGFKDPSAGGGDQAEKRKAFDELVKNLKPKIEKLIRLPVATMDTVNLKFKLREIYNND